MQSPIRVSGLWSETHRRLNWIPGGIDYVEKLRYGGTGLPHEVPRVQQGVVEVQ